MPRLASLKVFFFLVSTIKATKPAYESSSEKAPAYDDVRFKDV